MYNVRTPFLHLAIIIHKHTLPKYGQLEHHQRTMCDEVLSWVVVVVVVSPSDIYCAGMRLFFGLSCSRRILPIVKVEWLGRPTAHQASWR